jgi:hypothetical protein
MAYSNRDGIHAFVIMPRGEKHYVCLVCVQLEHVVVHSGLDTFEATLGNIVRDNNEHMWLITSHTITHIRTHTLTHTHTHTHTNTHTHTQ